ncbi:blue light sensor protein [Meridianimarinicoccus roseus]|uniref:Blue light sensor protein n=1 Tax=Meridianimarinicoccus roseus TaxID=2072018 RepID=A0A2V2LDE5_9RHOB|nr:BLUF domain-containing protein [Meridianimarinicoccus roseus]PWR01801.1 blue light sensor protein [Meridianimarinicoccus roseus]
MSLHRVIYSSRPFGFDEAVLSNILMDARKANARDGITGALICRSDIYLQWLEGPETAVEETLARIKRDDRHVELTLHVEGPVPVRAFGDWAMLHDPATSWIWTMDEVADGAPERADPAQVIAFFTRLRGQTLDSAPG